MSIPPEFQFKNELDFIDRFLVPLIQRLGFSLVVNYHGQRERGKDLIFAEIDRFSDVTYYGLQAKYLPSVGKSDALGLVEDCKEAFLHEFTHPQTHLRHRIARFYVANGGSFSDEGRENFFKGVEVPYGGCVRLLDGKALLSLDRHTAINQSAFAADIIRGLMLELTYNRLACDVIKSKTAKYVEDGTTPISAERLRTNAIAEYLIRPFLHRSLDTDVVINYAENIAYINFFLDALLGIRSKENKQDIARGVLQAISRVELTGAGLHAALHAMLSTLSPVIPL